MSNFLLSVLVMASGLLIAIFLIWWLRWPYKNVDAAVKRQMVMHESLFKSTAETIDGHSVKWYDYQNKLKIDHPQVGQVVEAYCSLLGRWVKAECIRKGDGKSGFLNDAYFALDNVGQLFFSDKARPLDWNKGDTQS